MTPASPAPTPPRVSVLMPVYNTGRYIDEACESVLSQSLRDLELLLLDDGSTDDSAARARRLAERDPRVRLFARENRGVIAARNELLSLASAPLVAWMDSDDRALPGRLGRQAARFDAEPDLVCVGGAVMEIDPDGEPLAKVVYPADDAGIRAALPEGTAMRFPSTMMRRDAVVAAGGFREPFKVGEDFDVALRLSERGRLANLPDVILEYRLHPSNTSHLLSSRWPVYRDAILDLARERRERGSDRLQRGETLNLSFPPEPPLDVREGHLNWARKALGAGFPRAARKHALMNLLNAPHKMTSWRLGARVAMASGDVIPRLVSRLLPRKQ
jgi:glycosyltransferase involved in cell wall biosynthesis